MMMSKIIMDMVLVGVITITSLVLLPTAVDAFVVCVAPPTSIRERHSAQETLIILWKSKITDEEEKVTGADIAQRQRQRQVTQAPSPPPLTLEMTLKDGEVVSFELTSDEDCIPQIVSIIGDRFANDDGSQSTVAALLTSYWQQHVQVFHQLQPRIYDGPTPSSCDDDDDEGSGDSDDDGLSSSSYESTVKCRIELPSGLVCEVAKSTIPGAGLGLFVRKRSSTTDDVLQTAGSVFAGYSKGSMRPTLSGLSDYQINRAFEFRLGDGLRSTVWFGSKLMTIEQVLAETGARKITGHHLIFEDGGRRKLVDILPDDEDCTYFIPEELSDEHDLSKANIQTIGHFVNDLAGENAAKTTSEIYDAASDIRNILVLVPRVHAVRCGGVTDDDDDENSKMQIEMAGMPLLTLSKNVLIANHDVPLEIGLRYGFHYWNHSQE
jgi:hypothetical protein